MGKINWIESENNKEKENIKNNEEKNESKTLDEKSEDKYKRLGVSQSVDQVIEALLRCGQKETPLSQLCGRLHPFDWISNSKQTT